MISLGDAQARVHAVVGPLPVEEVAVADAIGLVIAEQVVAPEAIPPFANTAMDGFAIRFADLAPASAEESYLCHCWLPEDRVVVGTASGNLILLEAGNFAGVLSCSPGNGSKINCIVTHSTGFVCGCDKGKYSKRRSIA